MEIFTLPLGPVQANCYIVVNENKECVIIDPGSQGEEVVNFIEKCALKPLGILLTHAHFDHIGAVDDVVEKWNVPVYVHEEEAPRLINPSINGSRMFHMPDVVIETVPHHIEAGKELTIGSFTFKVYHTPGHSPGSLSYYLEEENALFSGDVLFEMGIGRTDLHEGDFETLQRSIREKLYLLPDETIVYSGHGNPTTIRREKEGNPFVSTV